MVTQIGLRMQTNCYKQMGPNHGDAANGLFAVRSMDGHFPGRGVRPASGHVAVADLNPSARKVI